MFLKRSVFNSNAGTFALRLCIGLSIFAGLLPLSTIASDETDVEILSVDEVGEYRPENSPGLAKVEQLIVEGTNAFRKAEERRRLERSKKLDEIAKSFAKYMAETDRYGHTADGREPHERAKAAGYKYCQTAENIAYFFRTDGFTTQKLADEAVEGWINSPGHRENMLRPHLTEIGVGVAQSETTNVFYAVQFFGRPRSLMFEAKISNNTGETITYQLEDRKFSLQNRFTRTHQLCTPKELQVLHAEETVFEQSLINAIHLTVTLENEELQVLENSEKADPQPASAETGDEPVADPVPAVQE